MSDAKRPEPAEENGNPFVGAWSANSPEEPLPEEARDLLLDIGKKRGFQIPDCLRKGTSLNLVVVLCSICLCVALLLSVVYRMTEPRIRQARESAVQEALNLVFEETLSFSPSPYNEQVYEGRDGSGALVGFSVLVSPLGYGGSIDMIVGVSLGCEVTGAVVVSHRETKGYGTRVISEEWFLEQFKGMSENIATGSGVDAISGATRSSAAVTEGVREAVDIILGLLKHEEGGAS